MIRRWRRISVNRITFVDLAGQVCTIDRLGRDLTVLSEPGVSYKFPVWSPNGRSIAAIGHLPGGVNVMRFDLGRGFWGHLSQSELYFGQVQAPLYLHWAPDSSRLSFLVGYPQSIGLYLSPLKGEAESQLVETGQPFFWDWMPDSAYMLVHTGGMGPEGRLNFIDQEGEDWGEALAAPGYFQAPAISESGRFWAFATAETSGQSMLVVEHHASGDRFTIPHDGAVACSWQPGGERLAFIAPDESASHFFGPLSVVDMELGRVSCLLEETVLAFFWSPNGRYLAVFTLAAIIADNVFTLDLSILDTELGTCRKLLTFLPSPSFVNDMLPMFDQYARSHRLWSPRSDALVLPILNGQTSHIAVVDLDGDVSLIAHGSMPSWSQN